MKALGLEWNGKNWSLSRHVKGPMWQQLFGLKCWACLRWSLGCSEHWLCGLCESCRVRLEDEERKMEAEWLAEDAEADR